MRQILDHVICKTGLVRVNFTPSDFKLNKRKPAVNILISTNHKNEQAGKILVVDQRIESFWAATFCLQIKDGSWHKDFYEIFRKIAIVEFHLKTIVKNNRKRFSFYAVLRDAFVTEYSEFEDCVCDEDEAWRLAYQNIGELFVLSKLITTNKQEASIDPKKLKDVGKYLGIHLSVSDYDKKNRTLAETHLIYTILPVSNGIPMESLIPDKYVFSGPINKSQNVN